MDSAGLGDRAARLLSRAIRIPTVNPPGNEASLAALYVETLRAAGLEGELIETPHGVEPGQDPGARGSAARRAGAWGRLRGTGAGRPVVLLSHLDVVPADPLEWELDPFSGAIRDGRVHGRGALDAKGVSVIHLLALTELSRRESPLSRDLIFLATPDEERGGRLGAGYVTRERPELLGNAELMLTEGGGIQPGGGETPAIWAVTVNEKTPCWLELRTTGETRHSAAPAPDAAVPRLIAALDRVRRIETPITVLPEVADMFRAMGAAAPDESRAGYRDLSRALREDPAFRRRFLRNPSRNALVRDTIAITVLEGALSTNVVPGTARAELDVRLLPGTSCSAFRAQLAEVIDDDAVLIRELMSFTPTRPSPGEGSPLLRAIRTIAAAEEPGAVVVPRLIGGSTDAHWFRELGIASYGFVPRRLAPSDALGIHGRNEAVSIQNLEDAVRILVELLVVLDADTQP
ncbi:MAG: M20/M25/M40 family metallo-hydrolase [Deltaproteobacteria bacterium]|nr:M20/M25/M40 family metallo-hydrolase [Deltaproteobacteria bacterium]